MEVKKDVVETIEKEIKRLYGIREAFEAARKLESDIPTRKIRVQGINKSEPEPTHRRKKSGLARLHIQDGGDVIHILSLVNFKSISEIEKKYGTELATKYINGNKVMFRDAFGGVHLLAKALTVSEGNSIPKMIFDGIYAEMLECGKALSKLVQESKVNRDLPIKVLEI